jgi:site-specific recombinase XerD
MATVEIELRKYAKYKMKTVDGKKVKVELTDSPMPLVLRITSGKKISRKNTGLYIKATEWDEKKRRVNRKHSEHQRLNDALDALVKEAEGLKADVIKERQVIVPSRIMDAVFAVTDFYELAERRKKYFQAQNKHNTAKNYQGMISRLKEYAPALSVEEITPQFLEGFRAFLSNPQKPNGPVSKHNTIVAHLSKIAAVLNSTDLKTANPFKKVKRGTFQRANTTKLYIEDIEKVKRYIPNGYWEGIAKDTFLFSFYAAGMSSKDVLLLQWEDIRRQRIEFGRRKVAGSTGVQLSIPLNAVTEGILSRYDPGTSTVFNLVSFVEDGKGSENSYEANKEREKIQASINRALKSISLNSGVGKRITFKDARTAFAQIANEASQRNVYGIQQAMGHSKISTTEIYLGADARAVDELLAAVYR